MSPLSHSGFWCRLREGGAFASGLRGLLIRAQRDNFLRARPIEIGDEPPLRLDGGTGNPDDSRQVNIRWFSGTILAGFLGMGLLGTAIVTSTNGAYQITRTPEAFARWDPYSARARSSNENRKSDRISTAKAALDEARQTFRVSTTVKSGGRELVRTRPVTRITASLIPAGLNVDIPAFKPQNIFGDDDAPAPVAEAAPAPDGDISYVVQNLAGLNIGPDQGPSVSMDDVLASVRDTAAMNAVQSSDLSGFGGALSFAGGSSPSTPAFAAQNMTVLAKKAPRPGSVPGSTDDERVVVARGQERLDDVLVRQGATPEEARQITEAFAAGSGYGTAALMPGQTVKILMAPFGSRMQPVRVILTSGSNESIVAASDTGGYVAVADAPEIAEEGEAVDDNGVEIAQGTGSTLSLYQSLYGTAISKGVPKQVIEELVRVFGYDADFQRKVQNGDSFEVVFASDESGQVDGTPEVIYSSLISGGETRRYYRYQLPDDGGFDYFDEDGRSARKFLVRKPVTNAVMRSGFGLRRHPILGYSKMHTGVDWAAPRGTPIYAAGNGVVEYAKKSGGYGNQVKIQHANGYETAYGHMSGFAKGIKEGTRVRQGQLIGYVGSTGLSTGPHCHYEVLVNGRFVNPMRIKVPRGKELEGPALAEFQRERERIDTLIGRPATAGSALLTVNKEGG